MSLFSDVPVGADAKLALEAFLSAGICEQPNGMPLTMLSAFARLNVDPLKEAVRLAGLPRAVAAATLAKIIGRLLGSAVLFDATSTASRLVKLLPTLEATEFAASPKGELRAQLPSFLGRWRTPAIWQIVLIAVLAGIVAWGY